MPTTPTPSRSFVPPDLLPDNWSQLEPLYQALLARPIGSAAGLQQWLLDFSELSAVVSEYGARKMIDKSCHTDDPAIEKAYLHFVENIRPKLQPLFFELQKKFLESPFQRELAQGEAPATRLAVLTREWRNDVELFRQENVPLQTELTKLSSDYDKVCGAMLVEFDGQTRTLQQMARYLEEPDRPQRQQAWELTANRRLADRDKIEAIFEQQLALRAKIAANADLADFRQYIWKSYNRFDYTPEDCLNFGAAIERACLPVVRQLDEQRRKDLGLARLRPWDLAVDPKNRPALRPFAPERTEELVAGCRTIFNRLSSSLGEQFALLTPGRNLDLGSRKSKRPGGYQSSLEECREPFIFMNAAGLQRDVETLLHEGGHAFHYLAARDEPLIFLRHAPIEFCEVASMSMELLGADHLDVFYGQAGAGDALRAKRNLLEGIIRFLPWMATIDGFQHWLYTHPGHTRQQRGDAWMAVLDRFSNAAVDWSGFEAVRASLWQRQLHLFSYPFYYIEYGIAQLGALQLWLKHRQDPSAALDGYRRALALGGTRTLPELFTAAGIRFDFSEATLRPLMQAVGQTMTELPS